MRRNAIFGRGRVGAVAALGFAVVAACSHLTDTLLEATDPDVINPGNIQSAEGATALYQGAIRRLTEITGGNESTWLFGGLLVDEWSTSSTFVQNDETDQRSIQENNSSINNMLYRLNRTRTATNQAIAALNQYRPTDKVLIAEMYLARGFAELQLASDFCNGIPLSDGAADPPVYGTPLSVAEVFGRSVGSLDSAIALATGTGATDVLISRAARVAKARAQMGLNQYDAAAATVAGIPTNFAYQSTFTTTSVTNTIWGQGLSATRYAIGDSLEGNGRNLVVANAIGFASAGDPRLPVVDTRRTTPSASQDGQTYKRTTVLYQQLTPVDVVNGIDARLIEAEAKLKGGDVPGWLAILNALRTAPQTLGSLAVPAMAALTDPGTADARVNMQFREKAFWTFSRGQRLGDLRRLIRQYGRSADATFPTGVHYKGGNYGSDLNLPVTTAERNNPSFNGCTNRDA
jgi:hypothetical protein